MEPTEIKNITKRDIKDLYSILFQDEIMKLFELEDRQIAIITMMWEGGKDFKKIAEEYKLTEHTIINIYEQAIRRIRRRISYIVKEYQKHREVVKENVKLQEENQYYKRKYEKIDLKEKALNPLNNILISSLNLSVRANNVLKINDIYTIGELMEYKRLDLLRLSNFGKKTLCEIENLLQKQFGLKFKSFSN